MILSIIAKPRDDLLLSFSVLAASRPVKGSSRDGRPDMLYRILRGRVVQFCTPCPVKTMDVASEDYDNYLIVTVVTPDQETQAWSLFIYICQAPAYRITKRIEERLQFKSKEKAHVFGVKTACEWIDGSKLDDLLRQSKALNRALQEQIARRDLALETAKENERLFREFVESAPDATVIADDTGKIVLVNSQTVNVFGYGSKELLGKPIEFLIPQRFVAKHRAHRAAFTENPRRRPMGAGMELYATRKNGTEFPVEISLSPIQTKEGTLTIAAVRDITNRKEIERRLHEQERLATLGATAAVFAHEIGNPLNGLSNSIEIVKQLLAASSGGDAQALEMLESASMEVDRLATLLKEYRSFARPYGPHPESTNLAKSAQDVLASQIAHYSDLGVSVKTEFEEELPSVFVDAAKVKQAILNLCQNAVDAMPDGGTLTLRGYSSQRNIILEVSDSGTGIPEGLDVFQLFKTTKPEGTGLGLSIVQQIVSEQRGTIDYTSEVGKGTTFRLVFPISE